MDREDNDELVRDERARSLTRWNYDVLRVGHYTNFAILVRGHPMGRKIHLKQLLVGSFRLDDHVMG